jgi:hypothetical protein
MDTNEKHILCSEEFCPSPIPLHRPINKQKEKIAKVLGSLNISYMVKCEILR